MTSEPYAVAGFCDPVSSLTHLAGAAIFAGCTPLLLERARGDRSRVWSLAVFAVTAILLLTVSGLYHLWPRTPFRETLLRIDHGAIFLLIAGTSTPVHVILFRGVWRWTPLAFLWATAITGVLLTTVYPDLVASWLRFTLYLGMGWFGLISGVELYRIYGLRFILPLLWGGLAYTAGAALEMISWPILYPRVVGPHEIFHLLVLAGVAIHWGFMDTIAAGAAPPAREEPALDTAPAGTPCPAGHPSPQRTSGTPHQASR